MNSSPARSSHRRRPPESKRTAWAELYVTEHATPTCHVIVSTGPIDIAGLPTLAVALERAIAHRRQRVVLDLSAVTFLAEAGLTLLSNTDRLLAAHDGELSVTGANRAVRRLLQITGNSRLLSQESVDVAPFHIATSQGRGDGQTLPISDDGQTS